MEVCSATAADDDDALALRIEMFDVEDDDAAAALWISVNNVMKIRDSFIVFIILLLFGGLQAICLLFGTIDAVCFCPRRMRLQSKILVQ